MGILDRFWKRQAKKKLEDLGSKDARQKERGGKKEKAIISAAGPKQEKEKASKKKKKEEKQDKKVAEKQKGSVPQTAYRVLLRPLITEKNTALSAFNQYAFAVRVGANKTQIRQAIQDLYGVTPISIRVQYRSGKPIRYGRSTGRTIHWKKAIVSLKEGESIQLVEGV